MRNEISELGRFYLVRSTHRGVTYLAESDALPFGSHWPESRALELLEQNEDAEAIYEIVDGKFRDVSADLAEVYMRKVAADFVPGQSSWPAFVERYVSPLTLEELESDMATLDRAESRHRASYSVPA